jgi:predicted transcriptional regulator
MSNRSRNEIIAEMLSTVQTPSRKTAVMYSARLSYTQLKYYQKLLLNGGLVTQTTGKWVITEKGKAFLKAYLVAEEILRHD